MDLIIFDIKTFPSCNDEGSSSITCLSLSPSHKKRTFWYSTKLEIYNLLKPNTRLELLLRFWMMVFVMFHASRALESLKKLGPVTE